MAKLQKIVDGRPKETVLLSDGVTRIGRGDGNEIQLRTVASSKTHAKIECDDSHWILTDLGSRNGTRVNNVRIDRRDLAHCDLIEFAGVFYKFLDESDGDSSLGSESAPFKVTPVIPEEIEVEDSIRRTHVRAGDIVTSEDLFAAPCIAGARVLASVRIHQLPLASWNYTDSARKLSHVLRLTQVITAFHEHRQIDEIVRVFLQLFSPASHALLALRDESADGCRIVAAVSRESEEPVFLCHPLVRRAMTECEGLLVADHWRNERNGKPRVTELRRQSLICVPIPGANESCQGVIQLQASDPGNPFLESDLERLAVLAHVMGAGIAGIRLLL